jgi:hypothetical protein
MNQGTSHEEAQGPGLLLGDKLFFAACWPAEPGDFSTQKRTAAGTPIHRFHSTQMACPGTIVMDLAS